MEETDDGNSTGKVSVDEENPVEHIIDEQNEDAGNAESENIEIQHFNDIKINTEQVNEEEHAHVQFDQEPAVISSKEDIDDKLRSKDPSDDFFKYQKVVSYIKVNTNEDVSALQEEVAFNRTNTFDVQEDILGQELLNELYKTNVSLEADYEIMGDQGHTFEPKQTMVDQGSENTSSESLTNRMDLINRLKLAAFQRKELVEINRHNQSKLVEYFKLIKAKQKAGNKPIHEKNLLIDFNTQYERYREILQKLVKELETNTNKYNEKIEKISLLSEVKTQQNDDLNKNFDKYQENVGLQALHSRTGFKLNPDDIKDFFNVEGKKEAIIKFERLRNLKLLHKNLRFDKALRSKENFEGGLRLIDFEQLKIENQTFNEKVEERREALNKLNKKINNCNHLLSHIKEKINFTDNDKKISKKKLSSLNIAFKKLQKMANRGKKVRDYIKTNNKTLEMTCGLLGKKEYLRKYEDCTDRVKHVRNSILKKELFIKNYSMETEQLINKITETKKD